MILAPMAAMIVQTAISRTREYSADRGGAEICGHPLWLASALGKIAGGAKQVVNEDAERNPATAHMFIINPLSGFKMDGLFSTHPPTEDRIAALHRMEAEFSESDEPQEAYFDDRAPANAVDEDEAIDDSGPWGRNPGKKINKGPWS